MEHTIISNRKVGAKLLNTNSYTRKSSNVRVTDFDRSSSSLSSVNAHTTAQSVSVASLARPSVRSSASPISRFRQSSVREESLLKVPSGGPDKKRRSAYETLLCLTGLKRWRRFTANNKRLATSSLLVQRRSHTLMLRRSFSAWQAAALNRSVSLSQSAINVQSLHLRFQLHRLIDKWSLRYRKKVDTFESRFTAIRLLKRWRASVAQAKTRHDDFKILENVWLNWRRLHEARHRSLETKCATVAKHQTISYISKAFTSWKRRLEVKRLYKTMLQRRLRKTFKIWRSFLSKYLTSKSVSLPLYPDDQYREYLICWRIATTYRRSVTFHMLLAPKFRMWLTLYRAIQFHKKAILRLYMRRWKQLSEIN